MRLRDNVTALDDVCKTVTVIGTFTLQQGTTVLEARVTIGTAYFHSLSLSTTLSPQPDSGSVTLGEGATVFLPLRQLHCSGQYLKATLSGTVTIRQRGEHDVTFAEQRLRLTKLFCRHHILLPSVAVWHRKVLRR